MIGLHLRRFALASTLLPISASAIQLNDLRFVSAQVDAYACLASTPVGQCQAQAHFSANGVPVTPVEIFGSTVPTFGFDPTGPDTLLLSFALVDHGFSMLGSHNGTTEIDLTVGAGVEFRTWALRVPSGVGNAEVWNEGAPLDHEFQLHFQERAGGILGGIEFNNITGFVMSDLVCPSNFIGVCTLTAGVPGIPGLSTPLVATVGGELHRFEFYYSIVAVPEPETATLLALGLLALRSRRRAAV